MCTPDVFEPVAYNWSLQNFVPNGGIDVGTLLCSNYLVSVWIGMIKESLNRWHGRECKHCDHDEWRSNTDGSSESSTPLLVEYTNKHQAQDTANGADLDPLIPIPEIKAATAAE